MMQHNNTANTHRSLCALALVFTSTKWGGVQCSLIRSNTVIIINCLILTGSASMMLVSLCTPSFGEVLPSSIYKFVRRIICCSSDKIIHSLLYCDSVLVSPSWCSGNRHYL